jgi:hypothetical protein
VQLALYGSTEQARNVAKVGKSKSSQSLAARMPSSEIAAKVGMAEINSVATHRVVRLGARG